MTGGSQQLRMFRRAMRAHGDVERAAGEAGLSVGEARLTAAIDAKDPPPPEALELLGAARPVIDVPVPAGGFPVILADPPWRFNSLWGGRPKKTEAGYASRAIDAHYDTMAIDEIAGLPVTDLAATDCVLLLWTCWPVLQQSLRVIEAWGFTYKTCGFSWMKADPYRLFADEKTPFAGLGYWTRANTEPCLLATRGRPKRIAKDVRQGIIAPRREHSRKPDCVHQRIERLVAGPYLELFARQRRPGWTSWGNQVDLFGSHSVAENSITGVDGIDPKSLHCPD